MTNHPIIDLRRIDVSLPETFHFINSIVHLAGRRSDPSRDSSSFSSMCSGNGSGSLSPTDIFCQGKHDL